MYLSIKEIRKQKNVSQKFLAEKSDISVRMLSDYENNNADITLSKLQNIADVLECSIYDLIGGSNNQNYSNPSEIIALQNKIIALQEENISLKEENFKLKQDIDKLSAALGDDVARAIA